MRLPRIDPVVESGDVLMGPRVLLVCTANICRSPAAARLLAGRLGPSIDVISRGTRSLPGAGICPASATWALMNGGQATGPHHSRPLELADIKSSTLILTASQRQRTKVIEMRPSAQVRTFTLVQAARIAQWAVTRPDCAPPEGADLPHRLLWLAEELDANRGAALRPGPESADDLPDPRPALRPATAGDPAGRRRPACPVRPEPPATARSGRPGPG